MGAGGQMSQPFEAKTPKPNVLRRAPSEQPPFTLGDIKKAIPPHCFNRSILRSFSYLIYDLTVVFLLYYAATNYIHRLPYHLSHITWPLYWICQGCTLMGVWVIAHECGHNAFSDYPWLNNIVGLILHSALLIPYFSWKYSHRRHHSNTASLERDENFVPSIKSEVNWYAKYTNNPPGIIIRVFVLLVLGLPLYLMFNLAGRSYDKLASHYDPYSPIYTDKERIQIYISDAGVLATSYGLYHLVGAKGLAWVFCVYGVPLLIVNGFLVLITYLHHTHPTLPHYDSSEWDWMKGALATVDRDYGILNTVFHNITDTHVTHHLFSTIPHYHAMEATKAIKHVLGNYYQFDDTPIIKALWTSVKHCVYVEPDEDHKKKGVFWYFNKF